MMVVGHGGGGQGLDTRFRNLIDNLDNSHLLGMI